MYKGDDNHLGTAVTSLTTSVQQITLCFIVIEIKLNDINKVKQLINKCTTTDNSSDILK